MDKKEKKRKNKSKINPTSATTYRLVHKILRALRGFVFGIPKDAMLHLPEGPCLILANHTSFYDPLILISMCEQKFSIVAGEHLFHYPFVGWFLPKKMGAIPYTKGRQNLSSIREMGHKVRAGEKVALFGEGNITYDGETESVTPATGKLVKLLKCPVVTVRIQGAYAMKPRWNTYFGKGQVQCEMIHTYQKEEFAKLTPQEVVDILNRDLYVEEPPADGSGTRKYHCDANGIWFVLYACPCCGALTSITSVGRHFRCEKCGAEGRWTEYGMLESDQFPYHTLYEWNRWQKTYIHELVQNGEPISITSKHHTTMRAITSHKDKRTVAAGKLTITRDALICGDLTVPISDIAQMDTRDRGIILLTTADGRYYEIKSAKGYPGLLYKTVYMELTAEAQEEK